MGHEKPKTDEEVMAYLARPFAQVKRRKGPGGEYDYIDSSMVACRFDDACGPENWEDKSHVIDTCVYCEITITLPSGRKITRGCASGYDLKREGAREEQPNSKVKKTAFSDAFKRAALKFGVGRYLRTGGRMPGYYRKYADAWEKKGQAAASPARVPPLDAGTGKTSEPPGEEEFPDRAPHQKSPGAFLYRDLIGRADKAEWLACAKEYSDTYGYPPLITNWSPEQVAKFRINTGLAEQDAQPADAGAPRREFDEFQGYN
jgi:hypothetical protein